MTHVSIEGTFCLWPWYALMKLISLSGEKRLLRCSVRHFLRGTFHSSQHRPWHNHFCLWDHSLVWTNLFLVVMKGLKCNTTLALPNTLAMASQVLWNMGCFVEDWMRVYPPMFTWFFCQAWQLTHQILLLLWILWLGVTWFHTGRFRWLFPWTTPWS